MDRSTVDDAVAAAWGAADEGEIERAWACLQGLLDAAEREAPAARGLARALRHEALDAARRLEVAQRLLDRWPSETGVLSSLGLATESLTDRRYLNAAPPTHPFFARIVEALAARCEDAPEGEDGAAAFDALASAARIAGRRWDATCEAAHASLLARAPDEWRHHYNLGLFYKTRGRFAEGIQANRAAARLGGADQDGVLWNLGICATGAGDGATALAEWERLGCKLAIGDDGLPAGSWESVQVRLAERPLASRDAEHDEPGLEETIWIERLSPCHGRVVSALVQDIGVDHGDLVLFDGAPILSRTWGERSVPVFPHLVTLRAGGSRIFAFAATQEREGQVAELGDRLGGDTVLYVHTEMFRMLCESCWEREGTGHSHGEREHRVVTGKLVIPAGVPLQEVADALRREEAASVQPRVHVPDLWTAVGDDARADVQRRRHAMLVSARRGP